MYYSLKLATNTSASNFRRVDETMHMPLNRCSRFKEHSQDIIYSMVFYRVLTKGLLCLEFTYSIEIFYFHIYHEDFYGLSNNVLHVLGTRLFLYVLAT